MPDSVATTAATSPSPRARADSARVTDGSAEPSSPSKLLGASVLPAARPNPVLARVFEYWKSVDADLGKKVEEGVRAGQGDVAPAAGPSPVTPQDEAAKV